MSILSVTNVSGIAARSFVITCLVFAAAGCTARYPASPTPTPTLARIELHYGNSHEAISPGGSTVALTLYAVDTEGIYENVSTRARWYSTDTGVVQFSTSTTVRGVRDGSADVIAEYQGLTAAARIVIRSTPATVELRPPAAVLVGATTELTARLATSRLDVTDRCVLTSSDPTIVSVEGNRLTGRAPGTVAITVRMESTVSTFYISVPPRRGFP